MNQRDALLVEAILDTVDIEPLTVSGSANGRFSPDDSPFLWVFSASVLQAMAIHVLGATQDDHGGVMVGDDGLWVV